MCGIAGIYDFLNGREIDKVCLYAMIEKLYHRGPDSNGFQFFKRLGLGHSRLSIIDLQKGNQPVHNEDKTVWTVFNGEIFNFIELRAFLVKQGHIFTTQSDTEVIVHLYEEYGDDFVNHLNGQFAIALYDVKKNRLLLVRDRVGIVPLFYTQFDSKLIFASEVKSLLVALKSPPELNYNALDQIFSFWSPVSPETVFKNIYEVSPGQMLVLENNKIRKKQYWDWEFPEEENYYAENNDDIAVQLKELLVDATKIRLRSDVPVGAYLSGGLDSSVIVSLIDEYRTNPLKTFSIRFDDVEYDESEHQKTLINQYNVDHSYLYSTNKDISDDFFNTIWYTESPILRTAPVPMRKLSALVKEHDYKVVLTGEGADEVLGGYDIFKEAKIRQFWAKYPESKKRAALLEKLYPYLKMSRGAYLYAFFGEGLNNTDHFSFSHMSRWLTTEKCKDFYSAQTMQKTKANSMDVLANTLPKSFDSWHYFNKAQYIEAKSLMGGYLLCSQGDRMLMSNSIEGRFPFLDHRLIEFANKLHPKIKMKALNEKYILKKAMEKKLPASIIARTKQPYRAPNIPSFFNENTNEYVNELLSPEKIKQYGYFDSDKVSRLIKKIKKNHAIGNKDNMALVGILSTQVWHYHFIDNYFSNFTQKIHNLKQEKSVNEY